MTTKIGDAPNYPLPAQRLDKVDLEDTSRLLEETILRQEGQMMGAVGGLMSRVAYTYDSPSETLTLAACRFFASHYATGSTTLTNGGTFEFRPELTPNLGEIDLGPLGETPGWVFFKRTVVEADEENRAYFDALDQTKKVGLALTRYRESIEFVAHTSYTGYSRSAGYFPFLRVAQFVTGGGIEIWPIYAWEAFDTIPENFGAAGGLLFGYFDAGLGIPTFGTTFPLSLPMLLRWIVGSLQHAYDKDYTLDPATGLLGTSGDYTNRWAGFGMNRGIAQLDADLATAEAAITASDPVLTENVTLANALLQTAPLFSGIFGTGASPTVTYHTLIRPNPYPTPSFTRGTLGRLRIVFPPSHGISETTSAVTATALGTSGRTTCTYAWDDTYELSVYTYDEGTAGFLNAALSVVIHNIANPAITSVT